MIACSETVQGEYFEFNISEPGMQLFHGRFLYQCLDEYFRYVPRCQSPAF